jgi:L-cysteine:1D-myo-inositol 2-amino-2-deoxy-alpha-D-glucopyranoside ligase
VTLLLHDARRGGLHPFAPIGDGRVGLYVCGVTPYDTGHLGHAFTYVGFDVMHRYLEYLGHDVLYVQNLTDVDDDMLRRARETGEDYLALGNRHVASFLTEMAALNWLPPDHYPRATEHVPQMLDIIGRLLATGQAYRSEGHVYFSIESWPRYGELSHVPLDRMLPIANERGNVPDMPGKRAPLDFVLWQPSADDEPSWPSEWGRGRPGWHIECSAMASAYLGSRFEIHGGGGDLAFPHHESELAQAEAAGLGRPWVAHWTHAGMLSYQGEKMSKSLGNLVLVRDLLRTWPADAIRQYLVSHHYRAEIEFHEADLERSAEDAALLRQAAMRAEELVPDPPATPGVRPRDARVARAKSGFLAAMDSDLDTPAAMPHLTDLARLAVTGDDPAVAAEAGWTVRELSSRILGLRLAPVGAVEPALA